MAERITVINRGDGLAPATSADREKLGKYKLGQSLAVEVKQQSARSLQHHRLYWGGLLPLALDYWSPDGGLLTPSESATVRKFARWLQSQAGQGEAITNAGEEFLAMLGQSRAQKLEAPHKSIEGLHRWVKEQAGWYELEAVPGGVVKRAKSINFNAMSREQFNDFYRDAFSVVWRIVLSQHFESEEECQRLIDQLSSMG